MCKKLSHGCNILDLGKNLKLVPKGLMLHLRIMTSRKFINEMLQFEISINMNAIK